VGVSGERVDILKGDTLLLLEEHLNEAGGDGELYLKRAAPLAKKVDLTRPPAL
jgi:hypothetical protein